MLIGAGIIEDATKIWWDIRPSARYPTLEMRVTDVCTKVEDALAIAAVYVCLLSMLFRLRTDNQKWRSYARSSWRECLAGPAVWFHRLPHGLRGSGAWFRSRNWWRR